MRIPFVKAGACGNDFLIIEQQHMPGGIYEFSRRICHRTRGVGADGVEWVLTEDSDQADLSARLINSDGSEAEISGNGTRCVAAWRVSQRGGNHVRVRTGAGIKLCRLTAHSENSFDFEMEIGEPAVHGSCEVPLAGGPVTGTSVSIGNPHFVVLVSSLDFRWQQIGAEIQSSGAFPQSVNVEFVRIVDEHTIEARFFERGAGETMSSGTGSCASAVAAIAAGKARSPVEVVAPGGSQQVRWEQSLYLRGSAAIICSGEYIY